MKTATAVARKRARRPDGYVGDFIGLRVVVDHGGQIPPAVAAVEAWAARMDLRQRRLDDHFERPGTGGYRALHLDFELADPEVVGIPRCAGLEVQVTTAIFAALARVSHAVLYRRNDPELARVSERLEQIAADALELDREIARLAEHGTAPK